MIFMITTIEKHVFISCVYVFLILYMQFYSHTVPLSGTPRGSTATFCAWPGPWPATFTTWSRPRYCTVHIHCVKIGTALGPRPRQPLLPRGPDPGTVLYTYTVPKSELHSARALASHFYHVVQTQVLYCTHTVPKSELRLARALTSHFFHVVQTQHCPKSMASFTE
jgi:hypothetical protein